MPGRASGFTVPVGPLTCATLAHVTSSTTDYPRLMSLAVHEFRTPASVVGGYLRMMQRDGEPLSERQQKMIEEAEKSCGRLVALVNEMSELAKLDAGLARLAEAPVDVFGLVHEVAAVVHEASERNVHLEARGPGRRSAIRRCHTAQECVRRHFPVGHA